MAIPVVYNFRSVAQRWPALLDAVHIIEGAPGVAPSRNGPFVSPEVVVIAPFPLKSSGTDANVQVRGAAAKALEVRPGVKMIAGRFIQPGLNELIVGKNAISAYAGLDLGSAVRF